MAAIAIGDCTVTTESAMAGAMLTKIVTPSTADDADTVDVSSVCGTTIYNAFCLGATDGYITAAVSAAGIVTIPGATDNEARTIYVLCGGA